ncbi:cytochrome-c peroxidase [Candidatus Sulfurimonas baltica]|uniref:Cytochrome-c peroxidase n=1 Tax=Candidatus Sulfurimonas baltica TaxID=2740404 RepID=A0A7S7LV33_9BACT|nr:cytochrome-c peroxidase [Candidatus Sulfurimonas baltica]QOY51996.1 cytochrome-c peroxidase [Candidatus Sulfurimonas baltica]
MYSKTLLSLALATASLLASGLSDNAKNAGLLPIPSSETELLKLIDNPKNPITKEKIELGKKLYFDPRLSKSGFISCNSCHNLSEGGDDGISAAVGHKWASNPHHLNSPTVYNSVFFSSQFWDGRDPDLEKQAQGPIQAHPEMAATKEHVVATVTSIPAYVNEFKFAYGDDVKISFEKVTDTIAIFERTLVTPSAYDDYLNGKDDAMTPLQKAGLKTFIDKGCATCHNGVALGGEMNAFNITGTYIHQNVGDFKGNENGMVKVPTLRNITQTAPYFHNGKVWNLQEAIVEMGRIQVGEKISDKEASSIEEFLKALDGRKPVLSIPMLPASTSTTPKPDLN